MPQAHDAQDAEDIRRVLAGEPEAFAGLVARHGRRVHDLARRMLRDAHEAEDVTQHAFLNAYKALERFDPSRPFRHWLLRIASNLCRNRLAARRSRARGLPPSGGDEPAWDPPEPRRPPPLPGEVADRRAVLRRALEALPEPYRLVVVLRYVHELPLEAIAEVTGIPTATVKTRLHRGRAALREALAGSGTAEGPDGTE
jgi:RNA polymerase sigma-70 factor (ECF subfamily)